MTEQYYSYTYDNSQTSARCSTIDTRRNIIMTTKGEWVAYTGSDEQIIELLTCNGFVVDSEHSIFKNPTTLKMPTTETYMDWLSEQLELTNAAAYWIIPDDPLREMKLRHDATGQPVCVKEYEPGTVEDIYRIYSTTKPNWHIPNAEYSFTAFEGAPK